jgi:Arc/MetJ-type ribon-helix-helix transcriptional regulator
MKKKVSINIEDDTIRKIKETAKWGNFRNNSHLIEFVVNKFLRGKKWIKKQKQ